VTLAAQHGAGASALDGDLQLWTAPLDLATATEADELSVLSEEERERARRFRFERDSARYVTSRVCLRRLLAKRLEVSVEAIRLETRPGGKPQLAPPLPQSLGFSMSRSGPLALYALADCGEVGVDLEDCAPVVDVDSVGSRFFSANERAVLDRVGEEEKQRGFYRTWTRKEAVLKAEGVGLDAPLEALDTTGDIARWDPAMPGAIRAARRWYVHDLEVVSGHAAALACEWALPAGVPATRDAREVLANF
jgi:4'-phosphopantetheinyl transferase